MGAQIVDLASTRRPRKPRHSVAMRPAARLPDAPEPKFQFWTGASKTSYVHTVYRLIDVPEVQSGVYVLVGLTPSGRRLILEVGQVDNEAPSLNLAHLRHRGASLGAKEVHLHLLAQSDEQRRLIELDLKAGLLRTLSPKAMPRSND